MCSMIHTSLRALGAAFQQLGAADRVSLAAHAWATVLAGLDAPAAYLELTKRLSAETELAVWERAFELMPETCSRRHLVVWDGSLGLMSAIERKSASNPKRTS
jgi:hypothetical protein